MCRKIHLTVSSLIIFVLSLSPGVSVAAQNDQNEVGSSENMLQIHPGMSPTVLKGRPESELILLPSGRKMSIGKLNKLSDIAKQLRQVKNLPLKQAIKYKAAASGIQIKNSADLSAALQRPDNETVQLPSGKLLTVELLRYLQPGVNKHLGQNMAKPSDRTMSGSKAMRIQKTTDKEYWKEILLKPDATVLQLPDGKHITVGELKLSLGGSSQRVRGTSPSPRPSKQQ